MAERKLNSVENYERFIGAEAVDELFVRVLVTCRDRFEQMPHISVNHQTPPESAIRASGGRPGSPATASRIAMSRNQSFPRITG